jgi:hypothetical protein
MAGLPAALTVELEVDGLIAGLVIIIELELLLELDPLTELETLIELKLLLELELFELIFIELSLIIVLLE